METTHQALILRENDVPQANRLLTLKRMTSEKPMLERSIGSSELNSSYRIPSYMLELAEFDCPSHS